MSVSMEVDSAHQEPDAVWMDVSHGNNSKVREVEGIAREKCDGGGCRRQVGDITTANRSQQSVDWCKSKHV